MIISRASSTFRLLGAKVEVTVATFRKNNNFVIALAPAFIN